MGENLDFFRPIGQTQFGHKNIHNYRDIYIYRDIQQKRDGGRKLGQSISCQNVLCLILKRSSKASFCSGERCGPCASSFGMQSFNDKL